MNRRIILCKVAILLLVLILSSCQSQKSPQTLNEVITYIADKKEVSSKYIVDVKIPQINIDKPGAKSINQEIKARFYTDDVITSLNGGFEGIELYIKSDQSLNDKILSLRIRQEVYPSYGTDGDVYCVCYDVENDTILTPAMYMENKGYDYNTVIKSTKTEFSKETDEHIEYFSIGGVFINDANEMEVVAEVLVHPQNSDAWKVIYYYTYLK